MYVVWFGKIPWLSVKSYISPCFDPGTFGDSGAHLWLQDWGARCNSSANFDRYLVTHYFRPVNKERQRLAIMWVKQKETTSLGMVPPTYLWWFGGWFMAFPHISHPLVIKRRKLETLYKWCLSGKNDRIMGDCPWLCFIEAIANLDLGSEKNKQHLWEYSTWFRESISCRVELNQPTTLKQHTTYS